MEVDAYATIPKVKVKDNEVSVTLEIKPLVICKNCAYGTKVKNGNGEDAVECSLDMEHLCHSPYWFCADGEPKEQT